MITATIIALLLGMGLLGGFTAEWEESFWVGFIKTLAIGAVIIASIVVIVLMAYLGKYIGLP